MDVKKFAGYLGLHGDGIAPDVTDGRQLYGHRLLRDLGHHDGNWRGPRRGRGLLFRAPTGRQNNGKTSDAQSAFWPEQQFRTGTDANRALRLRHFSLDQKPSSVA